MSRLRHQVLGIALALACLAPLAAITPATAHDSEQRRSGIFYRSEYYGLCVGAEDVQNHNFWSSLTSNNWPNNSGWCGSGRLQGWDGLRIHPVHYKNGDGRGGYECMYNWGVFYNTENAVGWRISWPYNVSQLCGWNGYWTMDSGHSARGNDGTHQGGWNLATVAHYYG